MKIVTFNLRSRYKGDGINSFVHRAVLIFDKIEEERPDVIAFQEVKEPHLKVLERLLPDYVFVGQFRNENYEGEGLYTAVRKDSCHVLGFETIWLSPTPYLPGSRYENQSSCPRICLQTMVRSYANGEIIRIFNLHLDHISEEAKLCGMEAALSYAEAFKSKGNHPYVVLGDFNVCPDSEVIKMCLNRELFDVTEKIPVSFHKFGEKSAKIDYIFMSREIAEKAKNVQAWTEEENGIYLSDHYPICAEI